MFIVQFASFSSHHTVGIDIPIRKHRGRKRSACKRQASIEMSMTTSGMSKVQATALAHFVNSVRPSWDKLGITAACGRVKDRDPVEVAIAMLTAAKDPGAETPAAFVSPAYWSGWGQVQDIKAPGQNRDPKCERFVAEMTAAAQVAATPARVAAIRAGTPWAIRDNRRTA